MISDTEVKDSIVSELTCGSSCDSRLPEMIDFLWTLQDRFSACNTQLHYLLTKREALKFLMGCEASSYDTSSREATSSSRTRASSDSSSLSQEQNTNTGFRWNKTIGTNLYEDKSTAAVLGDMRRDTRLNATARGYSRYVDVGYGQTRAIGRGNRSSDHISQRKHVVDNDFNREARSYFSDCNFEFSGEQTDSTAVSIVLASWSDVKSISYWDKYSRNRTQSNDNSLRTHLEKGASQERGKGYNSNHASSTSFSQNVVDGNDLDTAVSTARDRMDRRTDANALAFGDGTGQSTMNSENKTSGQGTSSVDDKSEAKRDGMSTSNSHALSLANSQRFKHLKDLYDQITLQIDMLRKRIKGRATPKIATLPCYCTGECQCTPYPLLCGKAC